MRSPKDRSRERSDKAQAKIIVDNVFKAIADAAVSGAETSLPGFGKFKVKDSPAREGRNPSTGATIAIAASRKLTFTPAKAIKDVLNGGAIRNDRAS
jgi:DNA-binding protein HU-beta